MAAKACRGLPAELAARQVVKVPLSLYLIFDNCIPINAYYALFLLMVNVRPEESTRAKKFLLTISVSTLLQLGAVHDSAILHLSFL